MTDYNQPTEGASDWHLPLNENFSDLGIEVAEEVPTWGDLPASADVEQSTNGQWPVYRVEADDVFVRIDDTTKRIIGGTGSADHPLPESHHKALNAEQVGIESRTDAPSSNELTTGLYVVDGTMYIREEV